MRPKSIVYLAVSSMWLVLIACGLGASATSAPPGGGGGVPPTSAVALPTQPQAAHDASVDTEAVSLCQILPLEELATLAGAIPYPEAVTETGPSCSYALDPGDGTTHAYFFYLFPSETIAPMMDYVADYEEAEWLDGLGDRAYQQQDETGMYDLVVLVEGRYGLDMTGNDPVVLQAAARLILERLDQ